MEHISRAFEWIAVAVLIAALLLAVVAVVRVLAGDRDARLAYRRGREVFGRGILVGLEILVAADLVRTVAVEPTLESVGVLGLIVVVRTILSFAIDIEIDGILPWHKSSTRSLEAREPGDHPPRTSVPERG
ncbi:MAG TPA: DUF1622 domain-containing protein [Solirubrobacteraceae bacterium]|nr:DUF1622 domain-containing protein [Solirubrobacteraceae bacterium]